jgi:porphobilinogen synthase
LAYLDFIAKAKYRFPGVPLAAYKVSGEFSMTKATTKLGWLDKEAAAIEPLTAIRRAGASIILAYRAKDVAC